jgi:hypothetical protein
LINSSTHTICEFRLSFYSGSFDASGLWEIDASDPLYPGEEVTCEVEPGYYYEWKLVDCSHQVLEDLWGVKIEGDEFKVEILQTGTSYTKSMTLFRLINSSSRDICWAYLEEDAPYTHDPFSHSIMPGYLYPGQEFTRYFDPGVKRFQILDCDSNVLDEQWGVEFFAGEEFRWVISH